MAQSVDVILFWVWRLGKLGVKADSEVSGAVQMVDRDRSLGQQ